MTSLKEEFEYEDPEEAYLEISQPVFDRNKYIQEKSFKEPPFSETEARSKLTSYIIKIYAWSVGAILVVGLIVPFVPDVDKSFFKDFTQNILTSQAPIMTLLLGYYFGSQAKDNKK